MRASLSDRPAASNPAVSRKRRKAQEAPSKHLEAFLEMLAAERGAAPLTLAAYRNDLADLARPARSRSKRPTRQLYMPISRPRRDSRLERSPAEFRPCASSTNSS